MKLNEIMEFDHVIRVREGGVIDSKVEDAWAPEIHLETDDDGQVLHEHTAAMLAYVERQGWQLLSGWTGQVGGGPIMHRSEYIGGALEAHIRETPGYYAAVTIDVDSEVCPNDSDTCTLSNPCVLCYDGTGKDRERVLAGWAVAYRETVR